MLLWTIWPAVTSSHGSCPLVRITRLTDHLLSETTRLCQSLLKPSTRQNSSTCATLDLGHCWELSWVSINRHSDVPTYTTQICPSSDPCWVTRLALCCKYWEGKLPATISVQYWCSLYLNQPGVNIYGANLGGDKPSILV